MAFTCLLQLTDLEPYQQTANTVEKDWQLHKFLLSVLPDEVPNGAETQSKEQLIDDVFLGMMEARMSVRIT